MTLVPRTELAAVVERDTKVHDQSRLGGRRESEHLAPQDRKADQLPWVKQVVPVTPATLTNQARRFIAGFNLHVGHETLALPSTEIHPDQSFYLPLAFEIFLRHCGKKCSLPCLR